MASHAGRASVRPRQREPPRPPAPGQRAAPRRNGMGRTRTHSSNAVRRRERTRLGGRAPARETTRPRDGSSPADGTVPPMAQPRRPVGGSVHPAGSPRPGRPRRSDDRSPDRGRRSIPRASGTEPEIRLPVRHGVDERCKLAGSAAGGTTPSSSSLPAAGLSESERPTSRMGASPRQGLPPARDEGVTTPGGAWCTRVWARPPRVVFHVEPARQHRPARAGNTVPIGPLRQRSPLSTDPYAPRPGPGAAPGFLAPVDTREPVRVDPVF